MKVSGPVSNKHLMTYAFLDSGSDTTLCLRSLVEELSLESEPTHFTLSTVNYQGKEHGHQTCLNIEALDGRMKFTLDRVLTTESLPIGEKHLLLLVATDQILLMTIQRSGEELEVSRML